MQGRLLCVTSNDYLLGARDVKIQARPAPENPESGRWYHYPDPRQIIHARADGTLVRFDKLTAEENSPLGKTFRWSPETGVDIGFGMMVIDDFIVVQEKPQVIPLEDTKVEWETIPQGGHDRARSLLMLWRRYGCVQIAGEMPTEAEMERAKELRKQHYLEWLTREIDHQTKRRAGTKGYRTGFEAIHRLVAKEFGVALPETIDMLPRHPDTVQQAPAAAAQADPVERLECPQCGEMISAKAKLCRYCNKKFRGFTLAEMIAEDSKPPADQQPEESKQEEVQAT